MSWVILSSRRLWVNTAPWAGTQGKVSLPPLPQVNKPRGVPTIQTHLLPCKFSNCICSLLPNYQFLFGKLKKKKLNIVFWVVVCCAFFVPVFWGKGASFVVTQKKKQERYSLGQRPLKIRLFPQHSPIIHLPVKYVHSLSLFECLFLSDWGYMVIFVLITELLSFFSSFF